jgi:hypothetical protein
MTENQRFRLAVASFIIAIPLGLIVHIYHLNTSQTLALASATGIVMALVMEGASLVRYLKRRTTRR